MSVKWMITIGIVSFTIACNQGKTPEEIAPSESTPTETIPPPPSDSTIMKFSDEEKWLSELLSDKKASRLAAFKKYLSIRDTARNVSDLMSGYVKTYFSTYPEEFLDQFASLKNHAQEKVIEDIAHEFRASGNNYKSDLDQYFDGITNSCKDCSANLMNILKSIKQKIERNLAKPLNV